MKVIKHLGETNLGKQIRQHCGLPYVELDITDDGRATNDVMRQENHCNKKKLKITGENKPNSI